MNKRLSYYQDKPAVIRYSSAVLPQPLLDRLQAIEPYIRLRQVLSDTILSTELDLSKLVETDSGINFSLTVFDAAKQKIDKEAFTLGRSKSELYCYYITQLVIKSESFINSL